MAISYLYHDKHIVVWIDVSSILEKLPTSKFSVTDSIMVRSELCVGLLYLVGHIVHNIC